MLMERSFLTKKKAVFRVWSLDLSEMVVLQEIDGNNTMIKAGPSLFEDLRSTLPHLFNLNNVPLIGLLLANLVYHDDIDIGLKLSGINHPPML